MRETKVAIRQMRVEEAFARPEFAALCREYAAEAAIAGLPDPQEKLSAYQALEASGSETFRAYGAFLERGAGRCSVPRSGARRGPLAAAIRTGRVPERHMLIGFVALLTPVLPHYGAVVAVAESLFVAGAHRKSGAGMLLIRQAERRAREVGSPGMLFSAPSGGRLAVLLPRIGYRETNRVFFKELANA